VPRLPSLPVASLLVGASLWGVVWYPYRLLGAAGLDGAWASAITYGVALAVGSAAFLGHWRDVARAPWACLAMGLAIGWSNLAYVIGVLEGEVMRVLLLFYLAPLWTVPLARLLLGERLDARGAAVMAIAVAGAAVMLWHPEHGAPWPASRAEWLGVAAGFFFALGNVLVRSLPQLRDTTKSLAIWAGVTAASILYLPWAPTPAGTAARVAAATWAIWLPVGLVLVGMSLALQYGLSRVPANRAIVILLFELVVAAFASWHLAGEILRPQDWIGGALIVAASLVSGWGDGKRGES
jgi:drug/metabolite transporter (DMT)-like permease